MNVPTKWIAALAAAAAMGLAHGALAQEAAGDWHGTLTAPGGTLRVGINIAAKKGGGYEGSVQSPDQGPGSIPMTDVKSEGGTLIFSVVEIGGAYEGKWDAAQKAWVGEWRQGVTMPLVFTAGPPR